MRGGVNHCPVDCMHWWCYFIRWQTISIESYCASPQYNELAIIGALNYCWQYKPLWWLIILQETQVARFRQQVHMNRWNKVVWTHKCIYVCYICTRLVLYYYYRAKINSKCMTVESYIFTIEPTSIVCTTSLGSRFLEDLRVDVLSLDVQHKNMIHKIT